MVDCTQSDFLFKTEEAALKEAKKMFNKKEFRYLKSLDDCKSFESAVRSRIIYLDTYTLKEF